MMKEYRYGMRSRGFAPLCQPMDGFVRREDSIYPRYYDILVYDHKLTERELRDYQLDDLTLKTYKITYKIELLFAASNETQAKEWADEAIAEGEFSEEFISIKEI